MKKNRKQPMKTYEHQLLVTIPQALSKQVAGAQFCRPCFLQLTKAQEVDTRRVSGGYVYVDPLTNIIYIDTDTNQLNTSFFLC
jgi:hypothetical protein